MSDFSITSFSVADVVGVNPALQPIVNKQVTFYVGGKGPFYATFSQAEYSPDAVVAAVNEQVRNLKAIAAGLAVIE